MNKIDTVILTICRLTIGGVVVAAPWCLGGVLVSTQVLLQYGILAAIVLLSVRLLATRSPTLATDAVRMPVATLPLLGFLVLGVAQYAIPFTSLHGQSIGMNEIALPEIETSYLSVYPNATLIETVRYSAYFAVFVIVVCCFASAGSQQILFTAIAVNGMALAFFGIVQKLSWNGKLFWSVDLTQGGIPFASYVNRNNAAGYLNLALACAVGMLYARTKELKRGGPGVSVRIAQLIGQLNERFLFALVASAVIFVGILFSLSRGGLLAALVAILVTLVFTFKGKSRLHLLVASGGVLLVLVLSYTFINWLDPSRELESRFQRVFVEDISRNGRIQHWKVAIATGLDNVVVGTGLGTHRYSHLAYQRNFFEFWAVNADNQYVELFTDCGLVGVSLLLIEVALLWYAIRRVAGNANGVDPIAVISIFALSSQLTICIFDFGISLPANAMTMAAVFGMLVARDLQLRRAKHGGGLPGMIGVVLFFAIVISIGLVHLRTATTGHRLGRRIDSFLASTNPWEQQVTETDELIRNSTSVLLNNSDNAELQTKIARIWVRRYRQQAYVRLAASERDARYTPEMIWEGTSPTILHRIASREHLAGRDESVTSIRNLPEISNNLPNAMKHFRMAALACPVFPFIDIDIARLFTLTDDEMVSVKKGSSDLCLNAVVRTPADLSVLYSAGLLAYGEQSDDVCFAVWKRYNNQFPESAYNIQKHNRNMETLFTSLCERFETDVIIDRVMPENAKFYARFLQTRVAELRFSNNLTDLYAKMLQALDLNPRPNSHEWHLLRAEALAKLERHAEAIEEYRLSFAVADDEVPGRLTLVAYLRSLGRLDEAYEEATICRGLNPTREDIEKIVIQIRKERIRRSD